MFKRTKRFIKGISVIALLSITSCSVIATEDGVRVITRDGGFAISRGVIIWTCVGVGLLILVTSAIILWAAKKKK